MMKYQSVSLEGAPQSLHQGSISWQPEASDTRWSVHHLPVECLREQQASMEMKSMGRPSGYEPLLPHVGCKKRLSKLKEVLGVLHGQDPQRHLSFPGLSVTSK